MKKIILPLLVLLSFGAQAQFAIADFEKIQLATDSFDNGKNGTLLFSDAKVDCPVLWDTAWGGYWGGGWALSNQTDSTREGTDGLYQSITGNGFESRNYLIGQQGSEMYITHSQNELGTHGLYVTNTSYVYHSMLNGDAFAKKFGGPSGNDPDYLILHVIRNTQFNSAYDTIHFPLADFRFSDNSQDYIIKDWQYLNLEDKGFSDVSDTLRFFLTSSDTSEFGINTPTFFAIDHIKRGIWESVLKVNKPSIKLYPNPAQNTLVAEGAKQWTIYSIQGKALLTGESEIIDIRSLKSGNYVIRDNEGRSSRFIKQ